MSFFQSTLQTTVEDFEKNRDELVEKFNTEMEKFHGVEDDLGIADDIETDCIELDFLSKFDNLDSVAFIQIDIAEKDNSSQLFGEISKAVEEAIDIEINEITNVNDKTAGAQATPSILRANYVLKKKRIVDEVLLNLNGKNMEQNMMTLRCMDIYSEMAQTTEAISERTKKKMKEHEQILLFIGVTPKANENSSEAQLTEVVSYTIAVVSNLKDGTVPDVERYKGKVVDLINKSVNNVVGSTDIKATLRSFEDVADTLTSCKEQIEGTPHSKNFINTINAIENICQNQKEKINDLYTGMDK